ncbi:MAG: hypothetical protein NTV51_16970 [Verrucomicrobia bacterium]|nr:hypothetical protein [Verrucomicrobiota bacterium]
MKRTTRPAAAAVVKRSRSSKKAAQAATRPFTVRKLNVTPGLTRHPFASDRAARSAYVNAFCAFLHAPAQ